MMRAQTNIQTAVNRPLRERLGSLILAEQPSRRSSGALLHLQLYAAKTLHQIKGRAVDLNRIDRRPTMEPLAPTRRISGAALPEGGSFLNHGPSRLALGVAAQVTRYLFPSRATPICARATGIAEISGRLKSANLRDSHAATKAAIRSSRRRRRAEFARDHLRALPVPASEAIRASESFLNIRCAI